METKNSIFKPIQLVELDNKKVILTIGKQRLTDYTFNNFKEANNYLKKEPYDICMHICSLIVWLNEQSKTQNTENNEHKKTK